ncbi:lactoylglutathione lyase [Qipengyuania thermophila]|uniref:lactoylglutathione lyase n=1 Tax=Qipengyuania thermophila TaxID=2509361 RepID=UPI0018F86D7D|nr:lactoylglutathione lyase [Qipengyuania thermophila]
MSANPHGYTFNHTMIRVKDPRASLAFYRDLLGMTLLRQIDVEEGAFSLYFLAFMDEGDKLPEDEADLREYVFSRPGVLELTHNWGTEDEDGPVYHSGNGEPRGYGHIGLAVPDVEAACRRFADAGVRFIKRPEEGRMKHIAFIADPDGYWIEILSARAMAGR